MFPKRIKSRAEDLLNFIATQWKVTPSGGLSTTNHGIVFLEQVLIQTVQAKSAKLEAGEVSRCASRAIRDVIKAGSPTMDALSARFAELVKEVEGSARREFFLVTRCHFALEDGQDFEMKIGDAAVRFSRAQPEFDLDSFRAGSLGRVDLTQPVSGAYAVMPVFARSESAALEIGSRNVDLLFGALSYALEFGSLSLMPNPGYPIARAFPGREIGLFSSDRSQCEDCALFFSSVPFRVFQTTKDIPSRWERIRNFVWATREKELWYYKDFWRLYFHALAEPDVEGRVIRLWKLVECITFSNNEDEACRRIAAPFGPDNRDTVSLVFEALRMRRNWIAHNAQAGLHQDGVFEMARDLIDRFVLRSTSKEFPQLRDWRAFLELCQGRHTADQLELAAKTMRSRDRTEDSTAKPA